MTTFQDPQPQSRRAVRESERGEAAATNGADATNPTGIDGVRQDVPRQDGAVQDGGMQDGARQDFAAFPAAPTPPQQYFSDAQAPRDMWDTNVRQSSEAPAAPITPPAANAPATGRRSAAAPSPVPTSEPLSYSTQVGRSATEVPTSEPQSFRTRLDARQAEQAPSSEEAAYRVRDFSPPAQRGAGPQSPTQPGSRADLSYQTEARDSYVAPPAPPLVSEVPSDLVPPVVAQPAPVEPAAPVAESSIPDWGNEHTLTRRELRAMLAAQGGAPADSAPPQAAQFEVPEALAAPAMPMDAAPATVAPAPAAVIVPDEPATYLTSPPPTAADQAPPHLAPAPIASAPIASAPIASPSVSPFAGLVPNVPSAPTPPPAVVAPAAALAPTAPEPSTNTALTNALAEFDMLTKDPSSAEATATGSTKPVGHWSTQADLDDEFQVPETTINRRIGSGSTATNALVLPQIPGGADIRGPLTGTGEIMLTGSIDLPHTLSSTGMNGSLERDGIDSLFDLHDSEVVTTDSQPVRAVRAVSTHPSGHGVTHTIKPKGTKALTALLIAAASMAVVVAGLLIAAFAFNIF